MPHAALNQQAIVICAAVWKLEKKNGDEEVDRAKEIYVFVYKYVILYGFLSFW